jgi:hypothetical protein
MAQELSSMEGSMLKATAEEDEHDKEKEKKPEVELTAKQKMEAFFKQKFNDEVPFMPPYKPSKERGNEKSKSKGSGSDSLGWIPIPSFFKGYWSDQDIEVLKKRREAERRRAEGAGVYDGYIRSRYTLTNNPGGGNCLYYSTAHGLGANLGNFAELATLIRKMAAVQTAGLIRLGVGITPGMFGEMHLDNPELVMYDLTAASNTLDNLRKEAWRRIREKYNIPVGERIPDNPDYYAEVDHLVRGAIKYLPNLKQQLERLAEAYQKGQSQGGQYASDLDIRGIVLAKGINIHMHYVAPGHENCHREERYLYHDLMATYYGQDVPVSQVTIHIFHTGDNHYQFGVPKDL